MSLIELPSNTGKVFAVNPHHVTAVQPYSSTLAGRVGTHDMSAVWVRRDQGTNIFVCAWTPEQVLDALNTGKRADYAAWEAAYREALGPTVTVNVERMERKFLEWAGVSADV